MNAFLSLPIEIRMVAVFVLGSCLGAAVNWAIYGLAWHRRPISPWSPSDPSAPPRRPWDRLPILGWLGLRREAALHGTGFWVRPMLVELLVGVGFAWLYWWEVVGCGLLPPGVVLPLGLDPTIIRHLEFAAHCLLIALMLAGSLIDVDEKIIPDEITISGTLVGLLLAAVYPWSLLPDVSPVGLGFLRLTAPNGWPAWLDGRPWTGSLAIALACWWLWCLAILPRSWYPRHGWRRAVQLSCARLVRQRSTYRILRMAVFGSLMIALVWYRGGVDWQGLLSALVGVAAGGGLIWLVRIIGTAALGREAMGFGDVTLMAMIGAFVGWQPCLVIFFLAPVAGMVIGLLRLLFSRDREIPYGPFLCLATLSVIVGWRWVWVWIWPYFNLGWYVPVVMLCCLLLMALMLAAWRLIVAAFR
jgi:prepilin signal peptidase PulO-like enzyme (type II secretory pathway)